MASPSGKAELSTAEAQRLDRWLWFSRVLKSRTLAAQLVADGRVRVNRARVTKPSHSVRAGDVLTIAIRGRVMVIEVLAPGHRRGPPAEARQLYRIRGERQAGPQSTGSQPSAAPPQRPAGAGRPSKRDRRMIDRLMEPE